MQRAVIFDADGTLFNCDHRMHHIENEPKDWDSFFGAMHLDPVIDPVAWLAKTLYSRVDEQGQRVATLIVTARPEHTRASSEQQFAAASIPYDKLYMRPESDRRKDFQVKQDMLGQILSDGYEPFLVIDDRPEVVAMWREFGLVCLQCAPDIAISRFQGEMLLDILVGPAGAGKSTYCAKHYKPGDVISSDEVKVQLFGSTQAVSRDEDLKKVWRYILGMVKVRMENGIFTVVDATNLRRKDRLGILDAIPRGIVARYVVINRDYDEKIKDRGWRPVELIDKHHRAFKSALPDILTVDNRPNVVLHDVRSKK